MKKIISILLFSLTLQIVNSQNTDLDKKFKSHDWTTELKWFDSDTLILKTIQKKDTIWNSLSKKEKRKKANQMWTERISFDSNGNLKYSNYILCGNDNIGKLESIELVKNQMFVKFKIKYSNSKQELTKEKYFDIINWKNDQILLINSKIKN
jgi:hypothetical protein